MSNETVLEQAKKVATSVVQVLESKNFEDYHTMDDVGMNYDFYDGLIKGREESIRLIKMAFEIK